MADPYYTFYPGDYQRDTQGLSLVEHGAYRLLLDYYYTEGRLPNDLNRIYRICKAKNITEKKAVQFVLETFFVHGERTTSGVLGTLRNKRADKEIEKRDKFRESQREKALTRWEKENAGVDAGGIPDTMPDECLPSPSPSLTPSPKKKSTASPFSVKEFLDKNPEAYGIVKKLTKVGWKPGAWIGKALKAKAPLGDIHQALQRTLIRIEKGPLEQTVFAYATGTLQKIAQDRILKERNQQWQEQKMGDKKIAPERIGGILERMK